MGRAGVLQGVRQMRFEGLLERRTIGANCFLQTRRPRLPLTQLPERGSEVRLRHRPVERSFRSLG
jgi:hypothetical protein